MDTKKIVENHMNKMFEFMNVKPNCEIKETEDGAIEVAIEGKELNFLIGYQGKSLKAMQSLVSQFLFKETNDKTPISIDINGYRNKKIERLYDLTKGFIDKVRFFRREIQLPPMNAWERRQIHVFVEEYDDITSESTGEGRNRRVVLKQKEE